MRGIKLLQWLISIGAIHVGLSFNAAQASSVPLSELYINDPLKVQMVDDTDRNSSVSIRFWLSTPSRAAFDFGFMSNDSYISMTGKPRARGRYTFAGGDLVDFALRNYGSDRLFGTSDDLIYRISDSAGYAQQHYFAPVNPSRSRNPGVTQAYFQNLSLSWDLNLDGDFVAHTLIKFRRSPFDGMMPAMVAGPGPGPVPNEVPAPVPVPAALWLFGSGLLGLAAFARRSKVS